MARFGQMTATAGLLAVVFAVPTAAWAAGPVAISKLRASATTKTTAIKDARSAVDKTRDGQAALAHRITALKRLASRDRLANRGELERLLAASVEADQTLAAHSRAATDAEQNLEGFLRRSIAAIDREAKSLVPAMKRGTINRRKRAARRINALMKLRTELTNIAVTPRATHTAPDWSRYVDVKIDPLDGPSELADKADFVEDARDKYKKRRLAIRKLLESARQKIEIDRVGREVKADLGLFDEESVSVRVPRTASARATANTGAAAEAPTRVLAGQTPNEAADPSSPAPPTNTTNDGPESFAGIDNTQRNSDVGLTVGVVDDQVPGNVGAKTAGPAATLGVPQGPRALNSIDAQAVINVPVEDLGRQNLAPAALERLLRELQALDQHLAGHAKKMRTRARDLEADEARALDKK